MYATRNVACRLFGGQASDVTKLLTFGSPQLPALSYLDVGDVKREEPSYQERKLGTPAATASPTYQYPTGPPPPYNSHPAPPSGNGWPAIKPGVQTPPESRRTSGDESESVRSTARQSLPSISEALGVEGHSSYQAAPPTHLPGKVSRTTISIVWPPTTSWA